MNLIIQILILSFTLFGSLSANDVVGCGGFVISSVSINYQPIQIKLYTDRGILKYSSDCAPNNGYYFIPLYDNGNYALRIEPPNGWLFDPMEIEFNFDGQNDICSKQVDINFVFKGFTIFGKVLSHNSASGPEGVKVTLLSKANNNIIKHNITEKDGSYLFQEILPGQYIVEASHESWKFENTRVLVDITNDNFYGQQAESSKNLISVLGYSVYGSVVSDSQPIKNVQFAVFAKSGSFMKEFECNDNKPAFVSKITPKLGYKFLCHISSDKQGLFKFATLPVGSYILYSFYQVENIHFEVVPPQFEFEVQHEDLIIPQRFEIGGFTISGSVANLLSPEEKIQNIHLSMVDMSGKSEPFEIDVTSASGKFSVEKVKSSKYLIKATADHYLFDEVVANISPNTPNFPPITPSKYQVCGKIAFKNFDFNYKDSKIQLLVTGKESKNPVEIVPIESEQFCLFLKGGNYRLQVRATKSDLKFSPSQVDLSIKKPKLDVSFEQLTVAVSGKVELKSELQTSDPEFLTLTLSNEKNVLQSYTLDELKPVSKNVYEFKFENVLPGQQTVSLSGRQSNNYCWENDVIEVNTNSGDIGNVQFKQNGFLMKISLSHFADLTIQSPSGKVEQIGQESIDEDRIVKHCVSETGVYLVQCQSCHKFSVDNKFEFDTRTMTGQVLSLTATEHLVSFVVKSNLNISDLVANVQITSHEGEYTKQITSKEPKLVKQNNSSFFEYSLAFYEKSMADILIEPVSSQLLFKPLSYSFKLEDRCYENVATFQGRFGVIINGQINERIENVQITVFDVDSENELFKTQTDSSGKYTAGPFDDDLKLRIEPSKDGFIFKEIPDKVGHFQVSKLSSIAVNVYDEEGNALAEVLLSISGGENNFRQNSLANAEGNFHFQNLHPGKYFIRFLRKEYEFEPSSQMLTLASGDNVAIKVIGKKVAFSCLGTVGSLNGDPEPGVIVEAIGLRNVVEGTSITCSQLQEEAQTEADGSFRILGLLPQCQYVIRLKIDEQPANTKLVIRESIPRVYSIRVENSDLTDMRFIIFFENFDMDLSASVKTEEEYLPLLNLQLTHETKGIVYKKSFSASHFMFMPSIPMDGSKYEVRLEPTIQSSQYLYPEITRSFIANQSFLHLDFEFKPELRSTGGTNLSEQDVATSSLASIPLILIALAIVYKKQFLSLCEQVRNVSYGEYFATWIASKTNTNNTTISSVDISKKKTKSKKI